MKPFIIKNSRIPKLSSIFISVYAITLFPFIFIKDDGDEETLRHESIHIAQQYELFVVFFYLIYILDWLYGLFKYKSFKKAYYQIRFEQEAHMNHSCVSYMKYRKPYSWLKYKI